VDNPEPQTSPERRHRRRYLDRLTAFSDGVVAIALTLLVLPLVDLVPPDVHNGESTWQALADNGPALMAFGITFVVIAALWMAHSRLFVFVEEYDGFIVWANMVYLFSIIVLPFPSKWLQVEGFEGGVGVLYFLALATSSGSLFAISWHVARHPQLQTSEASGRPGVLDPARGLFFSVFFLVGAGLSAIQPDWSGWYLLALWPVGTLWGNLRNRRRPVAG
jgi:uncharacterized membrane protein